MKCECKVFAHGKCLGLVAFSPSLSSFYSQKVGDEKRSNNFPKMKETKIGEQKISPFATILGPLVLYHPAWNHFVFLLCPMDLYTPDSFLFFFSLFI